MTHPDAIVASWGRDWRAAFPERTAPEQAKLLAQVRQAVTSLQQAARRDGKVGHALHRKSILESADATFEVLATIPQSLQLGPFTPTKVWPALLRLSSAFPLARPDGVPDQRGLGVRIGNRDHQVDFLATTGEAHHARDGPAMLASLRAAAAASSGGIAGRLGALAILVRSIGVTDAFRLMRTVVRSALANVSLASLTFYSRAPFRIGAYAVRYRFTPIGGVDTAVRATGEHALTADLRQRLGEGPLTWSYELQGYRNPRDTPMDDHRVPWRSPWLSIATLVLHGETVLSRALELRAAAWSRHNGAVLEPLGDLNLLRATAYEVSRTGRRVQTDLR